MRYARKLGLAGVPGAILNEGDIRRAASFFDGEARSTSLGGLPATSADSSCATCAPSAGLRISDRIAAKLFREMGADALATAATDGKASPIMERVGALAAGLSESLKLRTDRIAVLGALTSPMFAKAVERTTLKLHGLKEPERFASALTLNFLMGATDDHAKRGTFYSDAYRKALQGMTDALSAVADPALIPMTSKIVAMLGTTPRQQTPRQLAGLGQMPTAFPAPNLAPFNSMVSSGLISRNEARIYEDAAASVSQWRQDVAGFDPRDVGTATRSPASLRVVDTYPALGRLWEMLVHPVQSTSPKWKEAKPFGNDTAAAINAGKAQAEKILADKAAGRPVSDANAIAAWIIRHYADRIRNYTNAGIGPAEWSRWGGVPWTPILRQAPNYEGKTWMQRVSRFVTTGGTSAVKDALGPLFGAAIPDFGGFFASNKSTRWSGDIGFGIGQNETNTGLWTYLNIPSAPDAFTGVTSTEFGRQCMIAYYAGTEQPKATLIETLTRGTAQFPVIVGYALALARRDALERTGQTGSYAGAEWVPNAAGEEQVPPETAGYADWFTDAGPNNDKPRWEAIGFVTDVYRKFYKRDPTRHAIGWYGRMGYGLGDRWFDLAPNDVVKFAQSITGRGLQSATDIQRTPEDARLAGADLPEEAAKDRSTWFAIIGRGISGVASVVIDAMAKGMDATVKLLCTVFKWLAGESAGGVICSILGAIVKLMVGATMGAIASLMAIVKGISLFLAEIAKGEVIKAFKVLILGINQSIFFSIGAPFAAIIGGDRMPFLKSQEKEMRDKAKAAGLNPDDVVLPSLERMADEMTSENPFFIFDVIFTVIEIVTSAGAALLKASGRLVYALCPVVGFILGPTVAKSIRDSANPDVNQWKRLTLEQIRKALTAIAKIIAAVVMGIIAVSQAIRMIGEPWKRYVAKKGGTAKAIWAAAGFATKRASNELTVVFANLIVAAKRGFKGDDPAMIQLKDALQSLAQKVPEIIIGFCVEELGTGEADAVKMYQQAAVMVYDSIEEAKRAYRELQETLYPATEYEVTPEPLPKDKSKQQPQEKDSRSMLPVFALAAGLVVGFMFSGGKDGA